MRVVQMWQHVSKRAEPTASAREPLTHAITGSQGHEKASKFPPGPTDPEGPKFMP